jgi:RNA exonuclease 1
MFTSKGLFSEVVCPYSSTCVLPRCIFKHPDTTISAPGTTISSQEPVGLANGQDGQRKRQKVVDENERSYRTESELSVGSTSTGEHKGSLKSSSDEKPKRKGLAATREISPPPLRRKPFDGTSLSEQLPAAQNVKAISTPTTPKVQVAKTLVKASLKEEGLNPRALKIPAPASHDMRFRLLRALHEQFSRLNSELARDASDKEEALVLSDQALITKALDIEEDAAATPSIYSNVVKNKILVYKRMSVKQWVDERAEEVVQAKAKEVTSISDTPIAKTTGPPKVIDTGLNAHEELTLLHRLYTPVTGLTKHGYVASIPTEKEIESAKQGIEAAKGWEVCDRCKSRFQVFPGRREEDGALASGGKCIYHFGKPYWQERSSTDPKAKRERKYRCCNESMGDSPGCTQAECHVFKISEVKRLAAVLNFEKTPDNHSKTSDRPVCIDGEMGYTVYGLELIRLTATSWPDGGALFDVLVRPIGPILDLNSRYSGVWPKDMAEALPWTSTKDSIPLNNKLRMVDSPAAARTLLFSFLSPRTPLIGHGLENDLNAARIIHPTIIDTALLYPHKAGLPYRNGLKMLMHTHLNKHIQVVVDGKMDGHDSKEDANAAGELVRFALANEWAKMKKERWVVKDGEFRPPTPKGSPPIGLSVEDLERMQPIKILSSFAGKKRSRGGMEEEGDG